MFKSFRDVEAYILENKIVKRIALCGAHDQFALSAVTEAKQRGIAEGVLIGDKREIIKLLAGMDEPIEDYEIIDEPDEAEAAKLAVAMVREGKADIPMKGLMQTSTFMRAILGKETGLLPEGRLLSQCTVFEYPESGRLMFASDCAINIAPTLAEKVEITRNAAQLAHCFGIDEVKVAVVSALEKVNPKIPSTVDAEALSKTSWEGCVIEGPFALDNAVSAEAAAHKGMESAVAGNADVLIMPDLCAGNVLHKALHFFAHYKTAGALCGTTSPCIFPSRTDSAETKYNSTLTAILQALA